MTDFNHNFSVFLFFLKPDQTDNNIDNNFCKIDTKQNKIKLARKLKC